MNDTKFSSSIKYLSSKLGKPETYIKNKCDLLKFGNSVKKLIVGGTEIRKDKLTEDQLLPIKDLPIEHRDPLALIIARDEMPVSDVKKIARMFKDKDISESTKGKLLYKTGHDLVETWSVFQNNRAERAKPAAAKAPTKVEKVEKSKEIVSDNKIEMPIQSGLPAASTITTISPIQAKLLQMLSAFPAASDLQVEVIDVDAQDKEQFLNDLNTLIGNLEQHLDAWKKVRELAVTQ